MIAFVILHYQAADETIQCIESIKLHVTEEKRIIIVDNASPNNSGMEIQRKYQLDPETDVILSRDNLGFARGNNLGYQAARKSDPDFIVVLNSDTLIEQDDFAQLVDRSYRTYAFDVLGPDIYSTKTFSHQNPQRETNFTLEELKRKRRILLLKNKLRWVIWLKYRLFRSIPEKADDSHKNYSMAQTGKVLHGAFYVFSRKFIEGHEECFYNGTFMYFESYILHYLGMKEKMVFLYDPQIHISHHEDVSTDLTYQTRYQKSVFVNKCSLASCEKFIKLHENNKEEEITL